MNTNKKFSTMLEKTGFSLIELLIIVTLIGILSAIAIPTVLTWLPNMRLNSASRDIYGVLMKAKGEAAKRNSNCTVIFNQTIGVTTFAYIMIEDNSLLAGRGSEYDAGPMGEPIILRQESWPNGVALDTTQGGGDGVGFPDNDDGFPSVTFRPTSIPTDNNGGLANGTIFLSNTNGSTKSIVIGRAGNVRIE